MQDDRQPLLLADENLDSSVRTAASCACSERYLTEGRITSLAEIARREGKVERHMRLPAPLAFVSPSIVADIADGVASPLGGTKFAKTTGLYLVRAGPGLIKRKRDQRRSADTTSGFPRK
jgi:hypothetical protein